MNRSLSLGVHFDIPVKVHWTFGLLFLFIIYIAFENDIPQQDIPWFFGIILMMFFFVIIHEFGHALMARRYGVKTLDIIISPIGGVARLESIPKIAKQELLIALAGPLVNVILAFLFGTLLWILDYYYVPKTERINLIEAPNDFIAYLFNINIVLVIFNLIPAFPMDGGRVLRSLISMLLNDHIKATKIASYIGQLLAVGFVLFGGYFDHYVLLFIGIFIFLAARAERRHIINSQRLLSTTLGHIAIDNHYKALPADPIRSTLVHSSSQGSFLVYNHQQQVVGVLPELYLQDALENDYVDEPISDYMTNRYGYLNEAINLNAAFDFFKKHGWAMAIIIDKDKNIKGVVDRRLLLKHLTQQ